MTNENIIKQLKRLIPSLQYADDVNAVKGAIQALEQEPCDDAVSRGAFEQVMWERDIAIEQLHELGYEFGQKIEPCDDAISRESVLNAICDYVALEEYEDKCHTFTIRPLTKRIKQLPSVTQKSGKWIIKEDNTSYVKTIPRRWAECSCCKWSMSPGYVDRYAFCPNCGAYMVESQERSNKEC